jgi:hypothetical protein
VLRFERRRLVNPACSSSGSGIVRRYARFDSPRSGLAPVER